MTYASQRDSNKGAFAWSVGLLRLMCKYPMEAALTFLSEMESALLMRKSGTHTHLGPAQEIYTCDYACGPLLC